MATFFLNYFSTSENNYFTPDIWQGKIQMGTLQYMSPEILEGCVNLSSSRCLLQGDVYSLGLLLWELLMRCSDLCKGINSHFLII